MRDQKFHNQHEKTIHLRCILYFANSAQKLQLSHWEKVRSKHLQVICPGVFLNLFAERRDLIMSKFLSSNFSIMH